MSALEMLLPVWLVLLIHRRREARAFRGPPDLCSICRRHHGPEVEHACE